MKFWLGTHLPYWLKHAGVPLFISRATLKGLGKWPTAICEWVLDSGAFSEIKAFGEWRMSETQYAEFAQRAVEEIGMLEWVSPMDWMCEPFMLKKTGLSVVEHQHRTVDNYLRLRQLAPEVPFVPAAIQAGWVLGPFP